MLIEFLIAFEISIKYYIAVRLLKLQHGDSPQSIIAQGLTVMNKEKADLFFKYNTANTKAPSFLFLLTLVILPLYL